MATFRVISESNVRLFFGVVLELASFTATVFPCPGAVVLCGLSSPKNCVLERDK